MSVIDRTATEAAASVQRPRVLQAMAGAGRGGAESFFARLCIALAASGLTQRVLIRRDAATEAALQAGGIVPVALRFGGALDFFTRRRFDREIRSFHPDLVLTWMSRATRHCPRGNFVHAARMGGYYPLKYYRHCDHLIGNTRGIVSWLLAQGCAKERVHYLPNFVDVERAAALPRAALDTPDQAPLLLALGRLHRNKAFDVLLRALVDLPTAYLWIAGSGPEQEALQRLAAQANVRDRVRFLGWRDDVAALFASADLFVCPSRVEPLGNVIIEAWAHGCPVIAADAEGPRELIRGGVSGLLAPVEDPSALARAISRVIEDRSLRERLIAGGEAAHAAEFSRAKVVAAYLDFFAKVAR